MRRRETRSVIVMLLSFTRGEMRSRERIFGRGAPWPDACVEGILSYHV